MMLYWFNNKKIDYLIIIIGFRLKKLKRNCLMFREREETFQESNNISSINSNMLKTQKI